jgi:hypothetical protein
MDALATAANAVAACVVNAGALDAPVVAAAVVSAGVVDAAVVAVDVVGATAVAAGEVDDAGAVDVLDAAAVDAAAIFATSATVGAVCRWDAVQFDEPHPVEIIKPSKPADTIRERDTREIYKRTKTPLTRLPPITGPTGAPYMGFLILTF